MRNVVKLLALILIMSVIIHDAKARPRIGAVKVFGPDDVDDVIPPVSGGTNVTTATGSVNLSGKKLFFPISLPIQWLLLHLSLHRQVG